MSIADPAHGGGVFAFPCLPASPLPTSPDDAPSFLHPAPSWGELECVLPEPFQSVIAGLPELRARAPLAWEGLIHRRIRVRGGQVDSLRWSQRDAGEWVLASVRAPAGDSWVVQHDFARRRAAIPVPTEISVSAAGRSACAEVSEAAAAASGRADAASQGLGVSQPSVGGPATHSESTASLRFALTVEDVAAWAEATGDDNPIHLHPGAAAQAGLGVSEDEVAAHGLYLAALSLAVVPTDAFDIQLRAPLGVPVGGAQQFREDRSDPDRMPGVVTADSASNPAASATVIEIEARGNVLSSGHLLLKRFA